MYRHAESISTYIDYLKRQLADMEHKQATLGSSLYIENTIANMKLDIEREEKALVRATIRENKATHLVFKHKWNKGQD